MKLISIFQLGLFLLVVLWLVNLDYSITALEFILAVVLGTILHWAVTNKGNRNIVMIRPFFSGWRVLLLDIMLSLQLIHATLTGEFFIPSILLNAGAIFVDYSVGG